MKKPPEWIWMIAALGWLAMLTVILWPLLGQLWPRNF
jgi:hypothetical protein